MAKKTPPYSDFKPFNQSAPGEKDLTYTANSDGVNKELGPKIILPPKPINEGKNEIGDLSHLTNKNTKVLQPANLSHLQNKNLKVQMPKDTPGSDSYYNEWPLTKFSFEIDVGGFTGKMAFQGMDGLGATVGKMEFRDGNSSKFYKQTRPTLTSYDPVTLKKGMFAGDTKLFDWFKNVSQGSMFSDMRTVSIHLSELQGNDIKHLFTWTLEKAYITKFTPSNLDGEADSELAVEEVELTYQSFSMDAGEGLLGSLLGGVGGLLGSVTGAIAGAVSGGLSGNISGNISF